MFDKQHTKYWLMLFLALLCFAYSIKTDQVASAAMAVILLIASNGQCDNKNLKIISKVLAVIVTAITVYFTFFATEA